MLPLPEQGAVWLIPPAKHEVQILTAAIELQLKVLVWTALTVRISALNPEAKVISTLQKVSEKPWSI
tara:strand:- start:685 stop:885 length:201 start_codon:yes stop_codon:yes gene_type:complete